MTAQAAGGLDALLEETGILPSLPLISRYVAHQRWSGARDGGVRDLQIDDAARVPHPEATLLFCVVRVELEASGAGRFLLPLGVRAAGDPLAERAPAFMIGEAELSGRTSFIYDATGDPEFVEWLWANLRDGGELITARGSLHFSALQHHDAGAPLSIRWLSTEQSNTSMVVNDSVFIKLLRRVQAGPSHELEMMQALLAAGYTHLTPLLGVGEYRSGETAPALCTLAQPFLHNATEGWALALTSLRGLYADAEESNLEDAVERHIVVDEQGGAFTAEAARLGSVVADMHRTLASNSLPEAMRAEPLRRTQLVQWADTMTAELDQLLRRDHPALIPVRRARSGIAAHFDALRELPPGGLCTRVHGDLHLGQVLRTDAGWYILDFEGEPERSAAQRRERTSPLRDVAGMLRSFDYAAWVALDERGRDGQDELLARLGIRWSSVNRDAFWAAYLQGIDGSGVLAEPGASLALRRAFEVQKAVYEVGYELGHRPSWTHIPISFLLEGSG